MKKGLIPLLLIIGFFAACTNMSQYQIKTDNSEYEINYSDKMPVGIVGDGKTNLLVQSGSVKYKSSQGKFLNYQFQDDNGSIALNFKKGTSSFFPGGVIYSFEKEGLHFDIMHVCLTDDPYVCFIRVNNSNGKIIAPKQFSLKEKVSRDVQGNYSLYKFATNESSFTKSWEALKETSMQRYIADGMILQSPSSPLNRAVAFNQFLLDLGYNDELIVCELFRYRDIWSRDLGSGFGPGALFTNRVEAAKNCIHYDMTRYVNATARALKTTDDASKGGSAEGTAWLTATLWDYYMITGDIDFLKEGANDIRPFVEAWIDRDYDDDGLIVDVTEWMDHSRHYLLPYGSSTTYSNALMVQLLNTFALIETELNNGAAASRYAGLAARFSEGINQQLWSEEVGAYVNLQVNGIQDQRTASAANALAVLAGVADEQQVSRIFETLETKNWKTAGSMTITPRTTHVDSDQNEKIWPWWNAVESLARFRNNNTSGGIRLLENCAATLDIDRFPGLMEETLDKDGTTEGGNTFVTGAGSFLTTVYKGLLGIEILEPGMKRIRIQPKLPQGWNDLKAQMPTPNGYFTIIVHDGQLEIGVFDENIVEIEVGDNVKVRGAKALPISKNKAIEPVNIAKVEVPAIKERKAAVFFENGLPFTNHKLDFPRVGLKELSNLDKSGYDAIIITNNALPAFTTEGKPMSKALESFIAKGGAVIFYGAAMKPMAGHYTIKMGSQGGVIEWYKKEKGQW
ncbi:MAG: hypothetical protein MI866_04695, partial [Bacteroidales bacterium]|nr:hypothetical protein [Bacteroidales bacterium]